MIYPDFDTSQSGAKLNCGIHLCPQRCHQLFDHSKMECQTIVESTCPRMHRRSLPCFRKDSICRKCDAEDREKERKKKRDQKLDAERDAKQQDYAQRLLELQDQISYEKRRLQDRAEQSDRENTIRQHQHDLENLRRHRPSPQNPETGAHGPVPAAKLPKNIEKADVAPDPKKPEISQEQRHDLTGGYFSASEEWAQQKRLENAQNKALDSLMEMIGLEHVKSKFLSIKSRVDTAVRQNIGLKGDRFGAALLGNPGTGKY